MRAVAVFTFAAVAAAQAPKCGDACNDGVHICDPTAECNLCMPKPPDSNTTFQCLAGCGAMCTADANCGSAGCGKCESGKCKAQPAPTPPPGPPVPTPPPPPRPISKCGEVCNDGIHDCDVNRTESECTLCMPVNGSNTSFACGVGCGHDCTTDEHCGAAGCGKCDGGKCAAQPGPAPPPGPPAPTPPPAPPAGCGEACNDGVHNCDVGGECGLCMPVNGSNTTFACGAGCGQPCTQDEHCGSEGCGLCASQKCVVPAPAPSPMQPCNGACQTNLDCDPQGECSVCVPKTSTTFQCSAPCLGACTTDAHCGVAGCMHCTNGTCASA